MTEEEAARPLGVRARARAELTRAIVETARRHLAEVGPVNLSLRAVARELGMVSSAVYRYVPSRDDLLTLLIVDAYDALGAAAEKAEAKVPRADRDGRFVAVAKAVRAWALEHPHEYALVYGTPVPGYAAPQDTIGPATRVPNLLVGILADAVEAGAYLPDDAAAVAPQVHRALGPLRAVVPDHIPDDLLVRGLMSWATVFGAVSLELFGQLQNVLADAASQREAFFTETMRRTAAATVGAAPVR